MIASAADIGGVDGADGTIPGVFEECAWHSFTGGFLLLNEPKSDRARRVEGKVVWDALEECG